MELHFFDPRQEFSALERRLPHWAQPGVVSFITWRTNDSIPAAVARRWHQERSEWLRRNAINPRARDWRHQLQQLRPELQRQFYTTFSSQWHGALDVGHGACVLKSPEVSKIVEQSLRMFDGKRYELIDFVVMPNHVHLLVAFPDGEALLRQCESWKHYQAVQINRRIASSGRFWQQDGFDHLVRSVEQFEHLRRYIAENPRKARLAAGDFLLWSRSLAPTQHSGQPKQQHNRSAK